ncbi:hypothetical protein C4D60_Mb10t05890 [Musa balbisiana]|uniref:EF-hand domain-containing protein n=1 Tax=Musa balbisiana TaxID=52838 RepID=A0A4S8IXG9_MUSBA|nr:hypothetical protein C4D60_Mb10t05890 [Musa balbisiana]
MKFIQISYKVVSSVVTKDEACLKNLSERWMRWEFEAYSDLHNMYFMPVIMGRDQFQDFLERADENKDGRISRDELRNALKTAASNMYIMPMISMEQREFLDLLERADENNDGRLSKDELRNALKASGDVKTLGYCIHSTPTSQPPGVDNVRFYCCFQ